MFRAIGVLIMLWGMSALFHNAFIAFDFAATETFKTLGAAAIETRHNMR